MKFRFRLINLILICMLISSQVFSQETKSDSDNSSALRIFTLENGLTVFVKEDNTQAMTRIELAVKAGYSSQSPKDAGFFPLYSNLFTSSLNSKTAKKITSSCNADSATFTTEVTPIKFEEAIKTFAQLALNPKFSDAAIQKEYSKMKNQVSDYESTTTGFLNSAIDSRVFSQEPWKQDSGIIPAIFSNSTIPEVRTTLVKIQNSFYIPQNSAFFISGNIDAGKAYSTVEKYFASWKMGSNYNQSEKSQKLPANLHKKFVLCDDGFSKEITQIILQWKNLNPSQADLIAASFTSDFSPYKKNLLKEPLLALRSGDYLTAASARKNGSTRLILQALMEEPYSFIADKSTKSKLQKNSSIVQQAELFLQKSKESAKLTIQDYFASQNLVETKFHTSQGNTSSYMQLLSDYWALENITDGAVLEQKFKETVELIHSESLESVFDAVQSEEPFQFLLVHPDVYSAQENQFKNNGYQLVTKKNASWYAEEINRKMIFENNWDTENSTAKEKSNTSNFSSAKIFYDKNISSIKCGELKNKIPVTVKNNNQSKTVLVSIGIKGGETSSPEDQRFLRTVLINAFASSMAEEISFMRQSNAFSGSTDIQAWTDETSSTITVNCFKDDVPQVLLAASNAILFGEISPVTADNLVYEQKYQWNLKTSSLSYQMECAGKNAIFQGTEFEKLFDANSNILQNTDYNSISLTYTQLLNAQLYNLVFAGDIDLETAIKESEKTFGKLRAQNFKFEFPEVNRDVAPLSLRIRLHHTYTTDMPAEMAGPDVPVLIPTEEFFDPVQFYFNGPHQAEDIVLFNAALDILAEKFQEELGDNFTTSYGEADSIFHAPYIQADNIMYTQKVLPAYQKALSKLKKQLEASTETKELLDKIKSNWIEKNLSSTSTNEGTAFLIQKGIKYQNNPAQYLEDYLTVDNATAQDFLRITEYFTADPVLKIYSRDSR